MTRRRDSDHLGRRDGQGARFSPKAKLSTSSIDFEAVQAFCYSLVVQQQLEVKGVLLLLSEMMGDFLAERAKSGAKPKNTPRVTWRAPDIFLECLQAFLQPLTNLAAQHFPPSYHLRRLLISEFLPAGPRTLGFPLPPPHSSARQRCSPMAKFHFCPKVKP